MIRENLPRGDAVHKTVSGGYWPTGALGPVGVPDTAGRWLEARYADALIEGLELIRAAVDLGDAHLFNAAKHALARLEAVL